MSDTFAELQSAYRECEQAYKEWLYLPKPEALRSVVCTILASLIPGVEPPWIFLVGGSGSGKTEIIRNFQHEVCEHTSTLTPKTLISGYRGEGNEDPSLLARLDGRVLCIKDFTTIMSLPYKDMLEILSHLRDAYDGDCSKSFGTRIGTVKYQCKFGLVAGVTNQIDVHNVTIGQWGERFVKCRMPKSRGMNLVNASILNAGHLVEMRGHLQEVSCKVLDIGVPLMKKHRMDVPYEVAQEIGILSHVVAKLRTQVQRNVQTGEILYVADGETGARLAQQFAALYTAGVQLLGSHDESMSMLRHLARSCPPGRSLIVAHRLWHFRDKKKPPTLADLSDNVLINANTVRAVLDILHALGIISKSKSQGNGPVYWKFKQHFADAMEKSNFWEP